MFDRFTRWLGLGGPEPAAGPAPPAGPDAPRCEECPRPQTVQITTVRRGTGVGERKLCDECARAHLARAWPSAAGRGSTSADPDGEVEIEVTTVILSLVHEQQVIRFQEVGDTRAFSFVCGIFEATALDRMLRGLVPPRPLTHDAWRLTLEAVGARVRAVSFREVRDGIYYADLRMDTRDGPVTVDLRPSDAVHLAIKARVPILIREGLLAALAGESG
jgi:bifunctional DNase/RNase